MAGRTAVHDPRTRRHRLVDLGRDDRLVALDVTRGVAMLGVIALNYHAILNDEDAFAPIAPSFFERLFNPVSGVLSTRFAATFVVVAGIGVALLSSRTSDFEPAGVRLLRQRLLRRGAFLLVVGFILEWIWPGTILFYYGAYFMIASFVVRHTTKWLLTGALVSVVTAAGLAAWRVSERFDDNFTSWLDPPSPNGPRNALIRLLFSYTHPVFPWIAFFLVGMVIGRSIHGGTIVRARLALVSIAMVVVSYALRDALRPALIVDEPDALRATLVSLQPFDRGILYVASTTGIAVLSIWTIERLVSRVPRQFVSIWAQMGRLSLSIYVTHILVFNLVVDVLGWVRPTGLDTALGFTVVVVATCALMAHLVLRRWSTGPIESLYRSFGG